MQGPRPRTNLSSPVPDLPRPVPSGAGSATLIVERDPGLRDGLVRQLRDAGLCCRAESSPDAARRALRGWCPGSAFVGLRPAGEDALGLVRDLAAGGVAPVVALRGGDDVPLLLGALRSGASDCLDLPREHERLAAIVRELGAPAGEDPRLPADVVARAPRFRRLLIELMQVAPTETTVLLLGETGTGKDLLARLLHRHGSRPQGPFVALNCGGVQASLVESELFGHERGAFTGADRLHRGVFERAAGGTLFLDELTEMPISLQVRLLRVLETRRFTRLGGATPVESDARVVAATNRDPERAVREGRLRADLYFRLCVYPLRVPPLRERREDVEPLARHFLAELNRTADGRVTLAPAVPARLAAQDWPGNVRELRNRVERAWIRARAGGRILPEHVLEEGPGSATVGTSAPPGPGVGRSIAEVEHDLILATLHHLGGDKPRAAATLGISLKTLYNRLNRYGLGRFRGWGEDGALERAARAPGP